MPQMRFSRTWLAALIVLALPAFAFGQLGTPEWTDMGTFSEPVDCIYFLASAGDPVIGFVGTGDFLSGHGEIYRTTDSGHSWSVTDFHPLSSESVTDIVFKDDHTGWATTSTSSNDQGKVYRTSDGGLTWSALPAVPGVYLGLGYCSASQLLFAARGGLAPLVSSDEGESWRVLLDGVVTSFGFVDGTYGFAAGAHRFMSEGANFSITTDGGLTWRATTLNKECYQPVMLPGSHEIFSLEEGSGAVYDSRDLGMTWDTIYRFPSPRQWMSGCIRGNRCGRLYAQSGYSPELGLVTSDDRGRSWSDLRPPALSRPITGTIDTRFFAAGDVIYAAQYATTAGTRHTVYRYRRSTATEAVGNRPFALERSLALISPGCEFADSTITIAYPQDCAVAKLVSAEFSDSVHFQLLSEALPKRLNSITSLHIAFVPEDDVPLNAVLVLRYMIGDAVFTDTIALTGSLTPGHTLSRIALVQHALTLMPHAGDTVSVSIVLHDDIPVSFQLESLSLTLGYDRDMVSLVTVRAASPWQLHALRTTDTSATAAFDPPLIDRPKGTTIATALFRLMLSKDSIAPVTLHDVTWHGDNFAGCTVGGLHSLYTVRIERATDCGDDLISQQLQSSEPIRIASIDQVDRYVVAMIHSANETHGTASLVSELGKIVTSQAVDFAPGTKSIRFTKPATRGVYYLVLNVDGSIRTSTVVLP